MAGRTLRKTRAVSLVELQGSRSAHSGRGEGVGGMMLALWHDGTLYPLCFGPCTLSEDDAEIPVFIIRRKRVLSSELPIPALK